MPTRREGAGGRAEWSGGRSPARASWLARSERRLVRDAREYVLGATATKKFDLKNSVTFARARRRRPVLVLVLVIE